MVFVAGSTLFLFRAIDPRASSQSSLWRPLIVSSILLGSASWGRQPYALLCAVPFLIVLQDRKYLVPALVYTSVVTTFLLPLLLIWQGLVPPSMQRTFQGLSFQHLVLSLGYGAVCFFLLAPRFFIERVAWPHFLFLVATVVINLQWRLVFIAPMDTAAQRVIPHDLFAHYATFCGGLLIGVGVIFAGYVTSALWEERHSSHRLIAYSGLLICCVSPVFVAGQYSSRYTAMALPYLLLAAGPWRFQRSVELLLTWLGAVAGALLCTRTHKASLHPALNSDAVGSSNCPQIGCGINGNGVVGIQEEWNVAVMVRVGVYDGRTVTDGMHTRA